MNYLKKVHVDDQLNCHITGYWRLL